MSGPDTSLAAFVLAPETPVTRVSISFLAAARPQASRQIGANGHYTRIGLSILRVGTAVPGGLCRFRESTCELLRCVWMGPRPKCRERIILVLQGVLHGDVLCCSCRFQ